MSGLHGERVGSDLLSVVRCVCVCMLLLCGLLWAGLCLVLGVVWYSLVLVEHIRRWKKHQRGRKNYGFSFDISVCSGWLFLLTTSHIFLLIGSTILVYIVIFRVMVIIPLHEVGRHGREY